MTAPIQKGTGLGWYILFIVLTFLFGWSFILGFPQTVRTVITASVSRGSALSWENALGAVLGWTVAGLLFFTCLRRTFRIQKARSERWKALVPPVDHVS